MNEKKAKIKFYIRLVIAYFRVIIIAVLLGLAIYYNFGGKKIYDSYERTVDVLEFNPETNEVKYAISAADYETDCAISNPDKEVKYTKIKDGKCLITAPYESVYIIFRDYNKVETINYDLNNILIRFDAKNKYYLALNDTIDLNELTYGLGSYDLKYKYNNEIIKIENNVITPIKNGKTNIIVKYNDKEIKNIDLTVTDTITKLPKEFDSKKKYLPCNQYTEEEAKLLDEILEFRINEAGYGTRAGVVAAARFLTLELPYRLTYFYENGRVHESGVNYADGEGRYYKKGLYLSESKKENIIYKIAGPAIWGCPLKNYEDDPPDYIRFKKLPNGLDCSGFVSWATLNGGFDVGDIGAGESAYPHQLTDIGEFVPLTNELIASNTIKPGDYFSFWGHISVIIGIDDDNFYVAESLNTLKGLVVKTYPKKTVNRTFTHVVMLDTYYLKDGNLTYMWY